jgi:PAS domain S-box-containing protein
LAQDALIESEDTANALLNAITETAVLIEPDGTILAGNETFARRFGGEADSLVSKNFYEILPPDVARDRKARIDNAIARIKPVEFVDERFGRFIENRIYPVTDSKGAVTKAAIYGKDITEQREADQKIRDNEERFRIIFEGQMTGILLIDAATHRIADLNDIAVRMIGYQKEMIVGKVCHRFVCPAEVGRCPVTDLGQDLDRSERVLINANAERVPILKSVRPIIFGGHRYLIESFTDITELKNAQLALKKSEEQLQAANRKLTLLSGITRHDILNIVSGIATFLYLLDISVPDEPEIKSYIGSIREQIGVISKILAVTLDYESLGIKAPVWINVADVSGKAARDAFTSGEIPVDITTGDLEVYADPMFEKVIYNLLENSRVHGKHVSRIRISFLQGEGHGTLVIEDNGTGIPANIKERIFEKGFGAKTGLGLFLAREILELTGMKIVEDGTEGKGSRFEITIPAGGYRHGSGAADSGPQAPGC